MEATTVSGGTFDARKPRSKDKGRLFRRFLQRSLSQRATKVLTTTRSRKQTYSQRSTTTERANHQQYPPFRSYIPPSRRIRPLETHTYTPVSKQVASLVEQLHRRSKRAAETRSTTDDEASSSTFFRSRHRIDALRRQKEEFERTHCERRRASERKAERCPIPSTLPSSCRTSSTTATSSTSAGAGTATTMSRK